MATTSGRTLLVQCDTKESLSRRREYQEAHEDRNLLDELNRKGYFVRKSALTEGITDIAVIIGNDNTPLKVSLSLVCTNSEFNRNMTTNELIEAIKYSANEIARCLGAAERSYFSP